MHSLKSFAGDFFKENLAIEKEAIAIIKKTNFLNNHAYEKFKDKTEGVSFFSNFTTKKNTGESFLQIEENLNFGKNDELLHRLVSEGKKVANFKEKIKDFMVKNGLPAEIPGLFNMNFQMAAYFYPSIIEFIELNKNLVKKHMCSDSISSFEINFFNIVKGSKNVGLHHQHYVRKGAGDLEYVHEVRNIHITLTESTESQPFLLWEGTGKEFASPRYIYKYLLDKRGDRNLLTKSLYLCEHGEEYTTNEQIFGCVYLRAKYYRHIYCNPDGISSVKSVYYANPFRNALIFNPYIMHGSNLLPSSNQERISLVLRVHNGNNMCENYKKAGVKKDSAECLSKLFMNNDVEIYKNLLNNGDEGVPSFSYKQLEEGLLGLREHYEKSINFFIEDEYIFTDEAKECIAEFIQNKGVSNLLQLQYKDEV
ncbi:MAG: hypothetical protein COA79_14360 [Planctomycetota bacterium]|nr:MAG: hypothetical protein COA79_14360 [Planctomycetota bacterium]